MSRRSRSYDLVSLGRVGIDLYSLDLGKPLRDSSRFARYVGGSAANVAVGGARLGLGVALVSKVSADPLGEFALEFLRKEGVDVSHVRRDPSGKMGIVFAEIIPGRDGEFVFYRENAADLHMEESDVPAPLLRAARSLLVTGTGLSVSPSAGTTLAAMRRARECGAATVLNLDWRPSLWSTDERTRLSRYREALDSATVVIGNEREHLAATGRRSVREALEEEAGAEVAVVTRGGSGATVVVDGEETSVPAFRVETMKGLGAGDGFIAGFLRGYLHGWEHERSVRFGNAVGAIVATRHACAAAMPSYRETLEFIEGADG